MPDQVIVVSPDSTGKAVHTRQRTVTVGGVSTTVEEQYIITISKRDISNVCHATSGNLTVQATAQTGASGSGFWWLYNPIGSSVLLALSHIRFMSQMTAALTTPTSPRIALSGWSWTSGSPAGAIITPRQAKTSQPAPVGVLQSTLTAVPTGYALDANSFKAWLPYASQLSSSGGPSTPADSSYEPSENLQPVLQAGQGIVCWQRDAGTSADSRKISMNITWMEFTEP